MGKFLNLIIQKHLIHKYLINYINKQPFKNKLEK